MMMSPPSWIGWPSSVRRDVAGADARLVGRAAGRDRLHERAVVDGQVEVLERLVDGQRVVIPR